MTQLTASEVIRNVMTDVQGLAKRERNTTGTGFNFRGIDAVMNAVGPALRTHGGFIVPAVDSVTYDTATTAKGSLMNIARVTVTYAVHGQTGDPILGAVSAEAFDSGDKATAKAMSVAYRTFLLQLLCLPTDEPDPDTFSYEASAGVDWQVAIEALTSKEEARALWAEATKKKAPKDIVTAIEAKGASLE